LDVDLAFKIYHWVFYEVLQRYLTLWDVWHARRLRYFGNEEDSVSFRNRSDCYCTSRLLASMYQVTGIPARLVYMQDIDTPGGHTAAEAFLDGQWRFLDVSCHDYALNRGGKLASFWEIMSDPYCRNEGLRADPIKVTVVLRLQNLANASIGNFPIADTTAHYRRSHGSFWFKPDSEDARRTCRFGF
jgi:transglutaminase-like putative cysteine protease